MPNAPDLPPLSPGALEQIEAVGPDGGPLFRYRDVAEISCNRVSAVCVLRMPEHPLDGHQGGAPRTVSGLVDWWVDRGCLPPWLKAAPKEAKGAR